MKSPRLFPISLPIPFAVVQWIQKSILLLAIPALAQIDTSILKSGRTWKYEFKSESRNTGSLEQSFVGTSEFRIDSLRHRETDLIELFVSRTDVGTTMDFQGTRTGTTVTSSTHDLVAGKFLTGPGGSSGDAPWFAYGGEMTWPWNWAVLDRDTLRYNVHDFSTLSPFPCNPTTYRYLESVGLLGYSYSAHCGITSEETSYTLLERDGKTFYPNDVRVLPTFSDFAPYALGREWVYQVAGREGYSEPIFHSGSSVADSLICTFQVTGLGRDGDSLVTLSVHVAGRKNIGIETPYSRGDTVDFRYLKRVHIRGGGIFPEAALGHSGDTAWFLFQTGDFTPFYQSHSETLTHLPLGASSQDTVLYGKPALLILKGDKEPTVYATGNGLLRKRYQGSLTVMPSAGTSTWAGEITLLSTEIAPLGISRKHPDRHSALRNGHGRFGGKPGLIWLDGVWFGADGSRRATSQAGGSPGK